MVVSAVDRATARSFVHQHLATADLTALVATLRLLYTDGYVTGQHAATVTLERLGVQATATLDRSEERRVGKECRSRWSPYH